MTEDLLSSDMHLLTTRMMRMQFVSLDQYKIAGRQAYTVKNPAECNDFKHLIGASVEIDGKRETVVAVERFAHLPPYLKDELIGLLVE